MAPDLNAVAAGGQIDYSQPGSSGYNVRQDSTWMDPKNRRLRVLSIGAGVSGILMAYQIQKLCGNVDHIIYEKNEDIAGTWLENRYPGCACDIPSHAYTYNFALNPDWPKFFSHAPNIFAYLEKVVETFDLRKYMNFNTEVVGCYWQEEKGEWLVKLREHRPGQEPREFEDHCHMLLHGTGLLNNFKWPDIPGLKDKFKGKVVHTASWPKDYQEDEWAKDRVAVIGSGASSIQTVPTMQKHAKHLDVFVRTGVWFVELASNTGQNKIYSQEERDTFRHDPKALVAHAKSIEDQVNGLWGAFYEGTEAQQMAKQMFTTRMAEWIKDERLLKGFTPEFGVGCRRITPGDPYMLAIQEENVDVHFTPVVSCTEDGVVGEDGVERKVDTIVCATGFDVTYRPRFPIIGKHGVNLADKWKGCPEAYLGVCIPDMPNLVTFIGPSWPVESESIARDDCGGMFWNSDTKKQANVISDGSVMGPLHAVSEYAVQWIKKMQNENLRSWVPRQDITDQFNEHVQEWVKHTVWKHPCRSWYKNNETGRVNAVYPGSSLHYMKLLDVPRYEDFDIASLSKNPWEFLGMGWTMENRLGPEKANVSPYLCLQNIDPKWYAACGGDVEDLKALVREERNGEREVEGEEWIDRRL